MAFSLCNVSYDMVSELPNFDSYFPVLIWVDIGSGAWDQVFPVFTNNVLWGRNEKREREGKRRKERRKRKRVREGGREERKKKEKEGREEERKGFLCCQCRSEELHSSVSSYQFLSQVDLAGDSVWSLHVSDFLNMFFLCRALLTVQEILSCNFLSSYHQFFSAEKNTLC